MDNRPSLDCVKHFFSVEKVAQNFGIGVLERPRLVEVWCSLNYRRTSHASLLITAFTASATLVCHNFNSLPSSLLPRSPSYIQHASVPSVLGFK